MPKLELILCKDGVPFRASYSTVFPVGGIQELKSKGWKQEWSHLPLPPMVQCGTLCFLSSQAQTAGGEVLVPKKDTHQGTYQLSHCSANYGGLESASRKQQAKGVVTVLAVEKV